MKWTRKTKEFEYADYISENGLYKIRDILIHDKKAYIEHIKNGGRKIDYWALLDKNENIIVPAEYKKLIRLEKTGWIDIDINYDYQELVNFFNNLENLLFNSRGVISKTNS